MEHSTKKIISKEEYHQLKNYQDLHNWILKFLDSVENKALLITGEIDSNNEPYLGGYTSDALNGLGYQAIDDVLKILGIEVEQDKIIHNKKETNKVGQKKKKFKSGQWAKNNKIDQPKEVIDSPSLHYHNYEFMGEDGNSTIRQSGLSKEELAEIMNIGVEENNNGGESNNMSLFVSETWNHDNDELGDAVG